MEIQPAGKTRTHLEFNTDTWEQAKEMAKSLESSPTAILKILLRLWVNGDIRLTIADKRPQ